MRNLMFAAFLLPACVTGNLVMPGIRTNQFELRPGTSEYIGIPQTAVNQTEMEIRVRCGDEAEMEFTVQFVLRSSPCDKEFFDVHRLSAVKDSLEFYFAEEKVPHGYKYKKIMYFKSESQTFNCKGLHGPVPFEQKGSPKPMVTKDVEEADPDPTTSEKPQEPAHKVRVARQPSLNGDTLDGGAKNTLSSWHPVQRIPMDGIYFLVMKITAVGVPDGKNHNVTLEVQWRGPNGYLSAIDYPLLNFYAWMCIFYAALAIIWMIMCLRHWKDLLRIQYWIGEIKPTISDFLGAVILLGMIEKAFFYAEYAGVNNTGISVEGAIQMAELVSCLKRTMARVLIIIVSVGYGVVKPRLGGTLNQVAGVGFVYFILCAIEGLARASKNQAEAVKQKQLAALPLVILEVVIVYWIFNSLVNTMRALRLRRNEVKLSVYRHFTNTLAFAVVVSVVFMFWSMYMHTFQSCMVDWRELWVDTAFWHILFCVILMVIMFLWRPSNNNQRYAFTPLLDNSEDENDEDEIYNSDAFGDMKQRLILDTKPGNRKTRENNTDKEIQEDLRWIEENIPSSLTDRIMMDDEEDKAQRELEISKML